MIQQHTKAPLGARIECGDGKVEIIGTVHWFHHHTDLTKLVTPYVLKKFSVVQSLHPDPMRARHTCPSRPISQHATRGRSSRGCRITGYWAPQGDHSTVDHECPLTPCKVALSTLTITQSHARPGGSHHVTAESISTHFHYQAERCIHHRWGAASRRRRQDVIVEPAGHHTSVARRRQHRVDWFDSTRRCHEDHTGEH